MVEKYFRISGRAPRAEYWWFYLFTNLVSIVAVMVMVIAALLLSMEITSPMISWSLLFFGLIVCLSLVIPSITVTIRRLHDTGRSGWWYLVNFIPYVGGILLLIFCVLRSEEGPNEYGDEWTENA
jgi:uncharacterized membrane protein YhaH (DUF805 family)